MVGLSPPFNYKNMNQISIAFKHSFQGVKKIILLAVWACTFNY